MRRQTPAIALRSRIFGEADLIVTYLCRDYGIISAFAKSPRKTKSRFGSSLEPLSYATISLYGKEDASLPRLTQADLITSFHSLREDLATFLALSELIEICLNFIAEKELNPSPFDLFLRTLQNIEKNGNLKVCALHCKIRLLSLAGYSPKLDECGRCGRQTSRTGRHSFFVSQGSLLCPRCHAASDHAIALSDGAVNLYRSLGAWDTRSVARVRAPEGILAEISGAIDFHIRHLLDRPLKSRNLMTRGPAAS